MIYNVYACSDIGHMRLNNEDNLYVSGVIRDDVNQERCEYAGILDDQRLLFAVCDGMGGEEFGELASLAAVKALNIDDQTDMEHESLANAIAANSAVNAVQQEHNCVRCGTTLVAIALDGDEGLAYNLGDSRAYLYSDGELIQLTKDHNLANYLVEIGMLTPAQAAKNPNRNCITRYAGMAPEDSAEPYMSDRFKITAGDVMFVCSDGLFSMIDDDEIKEIISAGGTAKYVGTSLVKAALDAGGYDNVTVVVICAEAQA
jgi:PPM family protein phosphatase